MQTQFDAIIVGSGPAGVSAAFPLLEAGLRVLMVDGGRQATQAPQATPYLEARANDQQQWRWLLGDDFYAISHLGLSSPKLRIPALSYVFEDFLQENHIHASNFTAIGSLAKGGLSAAWGCGLARFTAEELSAFPFPPAEMTESYSKVTHRIGASGASQDDLSEYFGLNDWSMPPLPLDELHQSLLDRYNRRRQALLLSGFRLGRARVAALSQEMDGRLPCDQSANCLWGCHRRALYSATDDLRQLEHQPNFTYRSGFIVSDIQSYDHSAAISGYDGQEETTITGKVVLLAAGTLATTRLLMRALQLNESIRVQASPAAAFMLLLPHALGKARTSGFALGQLSFTQTLSECTAFGSLFSTVGIPVSEFVRHMPFNMRHSTDLLRPLLNACVVGNVSLPGKYAGGTLTLDPQGQMHIAGSEHETCARLMGEAKTALRQAFRKAGALMLPSSFTTAQAGSSIHYACTFPMSDKQDRGTTTAQGEVRGLKNVFAIDGSSLTTLPEKSHTLTIMANADRIAHQIAMQWLQRGS